MRFAPFAVCLLFASLGGCGGPQTSQTNNAQANISNSASPPATAKASGTANGMVMLAVKSLPRDEALKIMHERHEGMETTGKAAKAAGRELQASSPDLAVVRASARAINDFAPKVAGLVPPGTGPETAKTGAKPEIWQNPQDFAAKARDFRTAAEAFNEAAAGNDIAVTKARFGQLMQACKACHDKYRAEMHH